MHEKYQPRIARNKRLGDPYDNIPKQLVNFDYNYDEWKKAFAMWEDKTQEILGEKIDIEEYLRDAKPKESTKP